MIKAFWQELFTPSGSVGPAAEAYSRGAEAVFHAVLGAAAIALVAWLGVSVGWIDCLAVAMLYSVKEITDRQKGGTVADSIEDVLAVFMGAILYGNPLMPIGILLFGIVVVFRHIRIGNVD